MEDGNETEVKDSKRRPDADHFYGKSGKNQPKPQPKKRRVPMTDQEIRAYQEGWRGLFSMVGVGLQMFVPGPFAPTGDEVAAISQPAGNIMGRHFPLPEVSEDMNDGLALVIAVSGYVYRVSMQPSSEKKPEKRKQAPVPPNQATRPEDVRFARHGEGTGLAPEDLQGTPEEVLTRLHEASYVPDAGTA